MRKSIACYLLTILLLLLFKQSVFAEPKSDLTNANDKIVEAINKVDAQDINSARQLFDEFNKEWALFEDDVKEQSKPAYGSIEEKMGMVQFLLNQNPVQKDKLSQALDDLKNVNQEFINGAVKGEENSNISSNKSVNDLLLKLQKAKKQVLGNDVPGALKIMDEFSAEWLDVEGVVLTQSQKVYKDAERDMVGIKANLQSGEQGKDQSLKTIESMYEYLTPLASKSSYTMLDAVTIILREGLEALLVVIALLAYLQKSGNQDKRRWIYGGVGAGFAVSIILAVIVQIVFASGTFGNNNFLIGGYTGVFAAVMLIYMSYWLHSKSNINQWQNYIKDKSTKALATGRLASLGLLAFLAVFREGTEIVLFYIGMASSIGLNNLLMGIGIGILILAFISILILKVGMSIPLKPFFLVSSILVFYLGLKFTGMGVNSLQLAGVIPASTNNYLPSVSWLGTYPSWEVFIPQLLMILFAAFIITRDSIFKIKKY